MSAAPDKANLPAHSRDVCPWTGTCPVHAGPTFADQAGTLWVKRADARRLARKSLANRKPAAKKPCFNCAAPRPEGLQFKQHGTTRPVCRGCYDARFALFHVRAPRWLSRAYRAQAVPA